MAETKQNHAAVTKPSPTQETSSHINVQPLYTPTDLEGSNYDGDARLSRAIPLHARRAGHDVSRPAVDDAAIRRHGRRRRIEPPLQVSAEPGHNRAERGFRSADADRAGFRQCARHGRSRQSRRGDRLHRGHDAPVRRHQPGEDLHLDDHQRHRRDSAGAVYRDWRSAPDATRASCPARSKTMC